MLLFATSNYNLFYLTCSQGKIQFKKKCDLLVYCYAGNCMKGSGVSVLPGVTTQQTSEGKALPGLEDQTDPHLYSAQSLPCCLLCLPDSLKLIRHPNTRSSCTATHTRMGAVTGVPYQRHLSTRVCALHWLKSGGKRKHQRL